MPYCPNCGNFTSSKFCTQCGTQMSAEGEQPKTPDASSYYVKQETPQTQPASVRNTPVQNDNPAADPSQYKLGWHKWIIYFVLWVWALVDISNGATCMQVAPYAGGLMSVLGVVFFALAVADIVVRFKLAKFKEGAPKLLMIVSLASAAISLVFVLSANASPYLEVADNAAAMIGVKIGWAIGNWRYYASRSELFIN